MYADSYNSVLDELISRYGAYENNSGVIYADTISFSQTPSLIIVYSSDDAVHCEVYDNFDGIQCTDKLKLPLSSNMTIYAANNGTADFLMLEIDKTPRIYTITDDCFTPVANVNIKSKFKILSCKNKKITPHFSKRSLYNFKNSLTEKTINEYSMLNCINTISESERKNLLTFVRACADIMNFDINDYDYDTFMQYLLSGNQNFKILTDVKCSFSKTDDEINIVNASYIDYILETYFNITPKHPSVNALVSKGFCVDNGYYYYKNAFNTFYATDVIDLKAVYKLNDNTYYTVFADIYRQGDKTFPEYSYAIIANTNNGSYNLIKLGMGKELLSEKELSQYMTEKYDYVWNAKVKPTNTTLLYTALLALISFGFVAILCGIVLIIQYIRCK